MKRSTKARGSVIVVMVGSLTAACSQSGTAGNGSPADGGNETGGAASPGSGGFAGSVFGSGGSVASGGSAVGSGGAAVTATGGATAAFDGGPAEGGSSSTNVDGSDGASPPSVEAVVRMLHRVTGDDDAYIGQANSGDTAAKAWLGSHWQMFEGFTGGPTAPATTWLPGGLLYFDTTAVNTGAKPPSQYILKRAGTSTLCYNPWGGNPNPQLSWDVTSEATRQYLIVQMKQALGGGAWSGLWLDDVNLDPGSSCVGPNDETWYTEFGSTWPDTWASAVATFMEEIRAAFPTKTLLENAPWFSRGPDRWKDQYVARQLKTASLSNREGGVLDDGLTTGTGVWSVKTLFDYVDAVHAAGAGLVWDSFPSSDATKQKYALAAYFIGYTEKDFYGDAAARKASAWPAVYDVDLGQPLGARTFDGTARFTRAFEKGTVVLDVNAKTGTIPGF